MNSRKFSSRKMELRRPLVILSEPETLTGESCLGSLRDELIDLIEETTWQ